MNAPRTLAARAAGGFRVSRVDLATALAAAVALALITWAWLTQAPLVALPEPPDHTAVMSTTYEPVLDVAATVGVEAYEVIRMAARRAGYEIVPDREPPPLGTLLIADFDRDGVTERELDPYGSAWTNAPTDGRLVVRDEVDTANKIGGKGYALRLDYDLALPGARGGYTLRLNRLERIGIDATPYRNLVFMLRQGPEGGPSKVRVDLKTVSSQGSVALANIGGAWQTFTIPLTRFEGVTDWRAVTELTITIESGGGERTRGALLVEEVRFAP